jgi:hypothetical protein
MFYHYYTIYGVKRLFGAQMRRIDRAQLGPAAGRGGWLFARVQSVEVLVN